MRLIGFISGPLENNCYIAYDEVSGEGAVIDVPLESSGIIITELMKHNIRLKAIILTHFHWDHMAEAEELRRKTDAIVYVHSKEEAKIKDPMKYTLFPIPFNIEQVIDYKLLENNNVIAVGNLAFEVYHTPGHTEGSICLIERNNRIVFSGDLIFCGSVGRTDFPGGSYEALMNSINKYILTLPDDFKIYSGHGPETTVGIERSDNPFLKSGYI